MVAAVAAVSTVRIHHDAAMAYAQDAILAKHEGNTDEARVLYARALPHELAAISTLEEYCGTGPETEPTRGILYLSAASLAWCAGDNAEARRLIDIALAGSPTPRTRADLLELQKEAA